MLERAFRDHHLPQMPVPEDPPSFSDEWEECELGSVTDERARRLLQTLEKNAHLAVLPTKLVYYGRFESNGGYLGIRRILEVRPEISSIRLHRYKHNRWDDEQDYDDLDFEALDFILTARATLTDLSVVRVSPTNIDILVDSVMQSCENLKHFAFSVDEFSDDPYALSKEDDTPTPTLRLESFATSAMLEPAFFSHLIQSSSSSLTSLEIAFCLPSVVLDVLPPFLPRPSVRPSRKYYDRDDEDEREQEEPVEKVPWRNESFAPLLANLPSTLVRFSLSFHLADFSSRSSPSPSPSPHTVLLSALSRPSFCPALRILDLADPTWEMGADATPEDEAEMPECQLRELEEEREKREECAREREEFRKACEERGVAQ
ncbi:hypothetical protein JCM8547_001559 [Rhodosporidiobolus lusitaniae]